jgi:hypothetical protein
VRDEDARRSRVCWQMGACGVGSHLDVDARIYASSGRLVVRSVCTLYVRSMDVKSMTETRHVYTEIYMLSFESLNFARYFSPTFFKTVELLVLFTVWQYILMKILKNSNV